MTLTQIQLERIRTLDLGALEEKVMALAVVGTGSSCKSPLVLCDWDRVVRDWRGDETVDNATHMRSLYLTLSWNGLRTPLDVAYGL